MPHIFNDETKNFVASGTYTPTLTAIANLDSAPTLVYASYIRVNNFVIVTLRMNVDATSANAWAATATLPIPSNLTAGNQVTGSGTRDEGSFQSLVGCSADDVNDRVNINGNPATFLGNSGVSVIFTYPII